MKVAGRKIVGSTSIPVRPGRQIVERRLDALRDVQRVRPRELLDDEQQARPVVDDRVADERLVAVDQSRHVAERDDWPLRPSTTPGQVAGRHDRRHVMDVQALVRRCR